VVGWNLESGAADPAYLSGFIADFQGVDLWGFSEVEAGDVPTYAAACAAGEGGRQFSFIVGTTGWSDRLAIVFNADKLELVSSHELVGLRAVTGRAPLYGVFKQKSTGAQFIFMVNHLHRTNAAKRMEQAVGLEKWAKAQSVPAVLVGNYNFDVAVGTRAGNAAFAAMTDEGVFRWVEPAPFRATHKGGSVLDFVFLSGPATAWAAKAEVVTLADDAVDTLSGSDHRPVLAEVTPAPGGAAPRAVATAARPAAEAELRQKKRNEILKRLAAVERELVALRRLVKELADE
jgi:endonuclease/exonuclease/phosphatase family metal-dependent hydrolase